MQVVEKPISQEEEDNLLAEDEDEERMEDARSRVAPSTITLSPTHSSSSYTTDTGNNSYMSRAYWTIRAARQATMSVRKLSTATLKAGHPANYSSTTTGSLMNEYDGRAHKAFHVHSYNNNMNISCSFDTGSMKCLSCSNKAEHAVLIRDSEEKNAANTAASCFILSDQNFPAMLPSTGQGECLKIIRIEDGSPEELASFFLETIKGFTIAAGSVCLISSASHLNWVGVADYIDNLTKAKRRISNCYGDGIIVAHGIPIFGPDCSRGPNKLGSMLSNVVCWLNSGAGKQRDIHDTRKLALQLSFKAGSPSAPAGVAPPPVPPFPGSPSASGSTTRRDMRVASTGSPSASGLGPDNNVYGTGSGSPSASGPPLDNSSCSTGSDSPSASGPAVENTIVCTDSGSPSASGSVTAVDTGSPSASVVGPFSTPSALKDGYRGSPSAPPVSLTSTCYNIKLPVDLNSFSTAIYECKVWDEIIHSADEEEEYKICKLLIDELNSKFCLDLNECISTERGQHGAETESGSVFGSSTTRFIVIGASHAERLSKALKDLNHPCYYVSTKHWKLQEEETDELSSEIAAVAATAWEGDTILIYHVYDNHVYFSSSAPGEKTKPRRVETGKSTFTGSWS